MAQGPTLTRGRLVEGVVPNAEISGLIFSRLEGCVISEMQKSLSCTMMSTIEYRHALAPPKPMSAMSSKTYFSSIDLFTFIFLAVSLHLSLRLLPDFLPLGSQAPSRSFKLFHLISTRNPSCFHGDSRTNKHQSPSFASLNPLSHNTILEFSISYFLVDLLHYLIFFPNDTLFILHHLATLYVFITCRFIVHRGSFALLALLILAEVTSLCQNVWTISGFRRADLPVAGKVFDVLSLPFYAFYTVVRGIMGPFFVYKMGVFYMKDENSIPLWAWVSWMIVIVTAILVSIVWVFDHWMTWFRRRNYQAMKKVA
ncbi:NAD(P)-binding Rossmann-fold superfamily protein isoform 1 [Hibiscus syriacus]|uniref:NAD(P)-binding Rossmann-fold superfamily protein isoform 1 n=1 Tax=Hibiscus syriacus TaxID=106335 RepID=A0A6A2Y3F6_HIBSY|nr:NAD(P)-binding Rossmann-fold superfamily protein isoform 1 [Hibiscus syriacus]